MLTSQQKTILKNFINADQSLSAIWVAHPNSDGAVDISSALTAIESPDFWVWKTSVSRADIYNNPNDLTVTATQTGFWRWDTYKTQGVPEQNAWTQIFMGDVANFSRQNVRDGVAAIFTGSAAQTAQRDHCLAMGRRRANRGEKLFSTGAGTTVSPALMLNVEGAILYQDIQEVMAS